MQHIVVFHSLVNQQLRRDDGATAVEYGLMVALVAIVIVAAVGLIGEGLDEVFRDVALTTALTGGGN